jgi:hypothetical protein
VVIINAYLLKNVVLTEQAAASHNLGRPAHTAVAAHFASHGDTIGNRPSRAARLAKGDLLASPLLNVSFPHRTYCSFKLIEVIFKPEFHIRHSSIPQFPGSETYNDFSRIASFLLALESCIRHAISSSFFSWALNRARNLDFPR